MKTTKTDNRKLIYEYFDEWVEARKLDTTANFPVIFIGAEGGALRTGNARITTLTVGSGGTVEMALDKNSAAAPIISATGPVSFRTGCARHRRWRSRDF